VGHFAVVVITFWVLHLYMGKRWDRTILALCSPAFLSVFAFGQIEFFAILALMFPYCPEMEIIFGAIKPQGVFLRSLRRANVSAIVVLVGLTVVSIGLWPDWPMAVIRFAARGKSLSLFPYSIPVGVLLFVASYKIPRLRYSRYFDFHLCLASLCLAPYFLWHATLPATAAFFKVEDKLRYRLGFFTAVWIWTILSLFLVDFGG
jgi:hypothetical protein